MNLHKIRGGNLDDLNDKKYNIGVGISLGNKWFTVENIIGLIQWCLPRTREYVVVYVADSIHVINLEVRKRISYEKASGLADQMGTDLLNQVKQEVEKKFSAEDTSKIHYVKWNTIMDDTFRTKVKSVYDFYEHNLDFKNHLISIVKNALSKEVIPRNFSEDQIIRLTHYIIEELPEQSTRVPMGEYICDAFAYPYDGEIVKLAEEIQNGEKFPEIRKKILDTEPKVFLEVR